MNSSKHMYLEGLNIKDRSNQTVAKFSKELLKQDFVTYAHIFLASSDLMEFMKAKLERVLPNIRPFAHQPTYGYRAYTGKTATGRFPDWLLKGAQALAFAEGDSETSVAHKKRSEKGITAIHIEGFALTNDRAERIATLSQGLIGFDSSVLARTYVAAVDLFLILNERSTAALEEVKNNYASALEFNKHENLPPNVSMLGVSSLVIPTDLEEMLRLVATASGSEYKEVGGI